MKNKLEYRIENGSLIIDNYFNNLKIGSINGGSVENILNKCKLYDEEYGTLLKENEYMKHIAKDFEQLQQENKKLNGAIQTYDILLKANAEENKQLQERIEYLERSNNRREDMVIELQNELCEINDYKEKWNDLKDFVNKMHEYFLHTDVNKIYKENMNANNSFPSMFNLSELNASDRILSSICKKMQELEGSDSDE